MSRHLGSPRTRRRPVRPRTAARVRFLTARAYDYERFLIQTHAHCQNRSTGRQLVSGAVRQAEIHAETCAACRQAFASAGQKE